MTKSILLVVLSAVALQVAAADSPGLASSSAVGKFVEYWNLGDSRRALDLEVFTQEFIDSRGSDGLAKLMTMLHSDSGAIDIHDISKESRDQIQFLAKSEKGNWLAISLDLAVDETRRVAGLSVRFASAPPGDDDKNLEPSQIVAKLERYLTDLSTKGAFSGSVILAKDFKPVYAQAFGQSNRASGLSNTLDTPINLGSMNKMFTGLAVTQLVAAGQLEFDDTVGEHLPDYPDPEVRDKVTVHQLLTHTSGLDSYWNDEYRAHQNSLASVHDFAQYVYGPAGMERSDHYDKYETISGKAQGYYVPAGQQEFISNQQSLGRIGSPAGGGYSSANDLLKFAAALHDGRLINDDYRQIMTTNKLGPPGESGYGYLYSDRWINQARYFGHNGGAPGINAELSMFPESGYTVIVLSNLGHGASDVANKMRQWVAHARQ